MGGRTSKRGAGVVRRVVPGVVGIALALASAPGPAADPALPAVTLRITWGGGKPVAHAGRIECTGPGTEVEWRLLSSEPGATSTMHDASGAIEIHEPRPLDRNGVEVRVTEWRRARVRVTLAGRESGADPVVLEGAVSDLLVAPLQQPLDRDGNKISVGRAPGDELRVEFTAGETAVRRPGETVTLHVHPLLPARTSPTASYELLVRGRRPGGGTESHRQALPVEPAPPDGSGVCEFQPLRIAVPLPTDEGGYDIELELVERGGLRWSRPVATRTIGMVAVAAERPTPPPAEWTLAYELDPGSPKLLERLRRLPGMGLPSLPTAGVTLPKLPRSSFALPKVPLPSVPLPTMPLPNVPFPSMPVPKLPAVNALVPRMTGLLAVGHSTLEIHDVGPLLKLPPAGAGPAWEGVALPASEPGLPQLVEIEYPLDQSMTLGLVVLEESDGDVRATATSGIHLSAPVIDDGSRAGRIGTRRFVFRPRTRSPLLVIANMSTRAPALFGRVRVLAGPSAVATRGPSPTVGRRTYLQIEVPDFIPFGAAGRAGADWDAFLGGIRHSADWALAQGAAGALVGVYADGAALWPSARTLRAPRWGIGGAFDGGLDPAPKDLLGLLGEVYGREQLRLVPAVVCDGPLPAIDGLIAAGDAAGLVAVGRDGAALAVEGGGCPHYNILDPRVQAEVEGLVAELAGRLRGRSAVDGVAMVLPHDGWLHLPGVAAGLDDATFARFVAESGAGVEPLARPALGSVDGRRFAARAALVEGPLRDAWLAWREAAVASFHARLADVLVAADPQWSLYVMPTTLFAAGRFAERFRPQLAADSADVDVTREAGLDPARLTAHAAIVYAAPHVHDVADDVGGRGSVRQVNRSLALMRATAGAARAAAVLVERPHALDLRDPAAQSSFGSAPARPVAVVAPVGGAEVRRGLAEALVAADAEAVFDTGLVHACIDETEERCREAVAALPAARLDVVASTPAPLVVRSRQGETGLWVSIVNAGGAACVAVLDAAGPPTSVVDAVLKTALPLGPSGEVAVPMAPWETKVVVLEGSDRIASVRAAYEPLIAAAVTTLLDDLQARRGALEMPAPLAVLDNPSFELPDHGGLVPGWELVETGRGRLRRVPGKPSAGGQGLEFASDNGLATMRSNPFAAPATGRISVAVWMRAAGASPQPPLRIALEGVQDDREFYRFAPVGLGPGAKPLSSAWSQFVLQIDDLPAHSLESLRVRLDLLGPGAVEFDDVRVFDLAFDESQRVRLSKILAVAAARSGAGDVGGWLVELDGPWPWFLREHVEPPRAVAAGQAEDPGAKLPARSGVVDRVRRWWQ